MTAEQAAPLKGRSCCLIGAGIAALVGTYFLDWIVPRGQVLNIVLTGSLLLVVVCFIRATRIAPKIRAATGTGK